VLLAYVFLVPFQQIYRFFFEEPIFAINIFKDLVFIFLVSAWLVNILSRNRFIIIRLKDNIHYNVVMLIFICYMIIQIIFAQNVVVGVLGFREVVEFMFAFFLAQVFLTTVDQIKKCIQLVFASAVIVSVIGIVQQILGLHYDTKLMPLAGLEICRLTSTLGDPNGLGFFLVIGILIATYYFCDEPMTRRNHFFILVSIVLMTVCLFFSFSRTAFVSLGSGLLAMSVIKRNFKILIISIVIIVLTLSFMPSEIHVRLISIMHGLDSGRHFLWQSAWEQFLQRPVTGVGFGKVGGLYGVGRSNNPLSVVVQDSTVGMLVTDNAYLFLLTEIGAVGFVIFVLLLFLIIKQGRFSRKNLKSPYLQQVAGCLLPILLAICVGAINFNIFGMFFPINFYFWLLAGILINLKNL
jgi:O-antigen ligase